MSMIIRQDAASQRYFRRGSPHNKDKPPNGQKIILFDIKNERKETIMKKMKKSFKKVLAQMLVLAMCLTMLPMGKMTVKADNDVPAELINSSALGSITVTKYVTTSTTKDDSSNDQSSTIADGTGYATDKDAVVADPSNYVPLKDAKFMLYKIADVEEVIAYYSGDDSTEYVISSFSSEDDGSNAKYGTETIPATDTWEGTTDANGVFKFEDLPVGIYVLKEVAAPDNIEKPYAETCLISVPMVNTLTSDNANAWLYDINVYPKNYNYGTFTLTKQDDNGSPLNGVQFQLSKKECTDVDTYPEQWTTVTAAMLQNSDNFTTGTNGQIFLKGLTAGTYGTQYKLEEIKGIDGYVVNSNPIYFMVKSNNTIVYNAVDDPNFPNKNNDVIEKQDGGSTPNYTLTLRNSRPYLEKKIRKNEATEGWDNEAQYSLDDQLNYKIVAYIPKNIAEIKYEIVDDTSAGITDDVSSIVVSYTDSADYDTATDWTVLANTNYKITDNNGGFKFELTEAGKANEDIKGKYIKISYSAAFNDSYVVAQNGNYNVATLTYSKYIDGEDDELTIVDETRVYTFDFSITKYKDKVDAQNLVKSEDGIVKFNLLDSNKNALNVVSLGNGKYRIPKVGETTGLTQELQIGASDAMTSVINVSGLENGTYYLREFDTIQGYNLLSDDVEIKIEIKPTTTFKDQNYDETKTDVFIGHEFVSTSYDSDVSTVTKNIINKKGFVLPQTGSMGYLLFCVAGILLVFGGAVLMFSGRKKTIR